MSAALWLRFALIRKFSVSRDNAPPFNHDFAATGVPGPKAAASGPGAGRTWVQGSRSVGSGLGEPSACSQVHLRSIGQMSAGEKGRGREASAPETTGRPKATTHLPEPNARPGWPAKAPAQADPTSEIGGDAQGEPRSPATSQGPGQHSGHKQQCCQGALSVTMRTRAFRERFPRPGAGPRA